MEVKNRIDQKDAIAFMKGGKAKFVLHTLKTDKQFRYRIKKMAKDDPARSTYWIYLENSGLDVYLGFISATNRLLLRTVPDQYSNQDLRDGIGLFIYCWDKLQSLEVPERLHILHMGFCGVCGRQLKDAHSLEIGIGPDCLKRML